MGKKLFDEILNFKKSSKNLSKEDSDTIKKKLLKESDKGLNRAEDIIVKVIDYILNDL